MRFSLTFLALAASGLLQMSSRKDAAVNESYVLEIVYREAPFPRTGPRSKHRHHSVQCSVTFLQLLFPRASRYPNLCPFRPRALFLGEIQGDLRSRDRGTRSRTDLSSGRDVCWEDFGASGTVFEDFDGSTLLRGAPRPRRSDEKPSVPTTECSASSRSHPVRSSSRHREIRLSGRPRASGRRERRSLVQQRDTRTPDCRRRQCLEHGDKKGFDSHRQLDHPKNPRRKTIP